MLRLNLLQPLLIEMNPAFVPVEPAFQFEPAMLRLADLMFQLRKSPAQLRYSIFIAQNICRASFDLLTQLLDPPLALAYLRLQHVELVAGELRVQMLQLDHELFVTTGLAGLALQ